MRRKVSATDTLLASASSSMMHFLGRSVLPNITKACVGSMSTAGLHHTCSHNDMLWQHQKRVSENEKKDRVSLLTMIFFF